MKKIIVLFSFLSIFSCSSQEKETVCLIFKPNSSDICNYSMYRDGSNKKESSFKYKKYSNKNITDFYICHAYFEFNSDKDIPETLNDTDIKILNVVDIEYLHNVNHKKYHNTKKQDYFENIFILEKINDQKYIKYRVNWVDRHIEQRN